MFGRVYASRKSQRQLKLKPSKVKNDSIDNAPIDGDNINADVGIEEHHDLDNPIVEEVVPEEVDNVENLDALVRSIASNVAEGVESETESDEETLVAKEGRRRNLEELVGFKRKCQEHKNERKKKVAKKKQSRPTQLEEGNLLSEVSAAKKPVMQKRKLIVSDPRNTDKTRSKRVFSRYVGKDEGRRVLRSSLQVEARRSKSKECSNDAVITSASKKKKGRSLASKPTVKKKKAEVVLESPVIENQSEVVVEVPVIKKEEPFSMLIRTSPQAMIDGISVLNEDQKEAVREMGFGSVLDLKLHNSPSKLGHYLVQNLDDDNLILRTGKGDINLTADLVHDILGIPKGGIDIDDMSDVDKNHPLVLAWNKQFKIPQQVTRSDLVAKIKQSGEDGVIFKINFIMLFVNSILKSYKTGWVVNKFVQRIAGNVDFKSLDWCSFVLQCVKGSKNSWIPYSKRHLYSGPITFLILTYLHHVVGPGDKVPRTLPAIVNWDYTKSKERETNELSNGGFGMFDIVVQVPFREDPVEAVSEDMVVGDSETVVDKSKEEEVVDIKAKLSRISRYREEIFEKLKSLLGGNRDDKEISDLKVEVENLFGGVRVESEVKSGEAVGIHKGSYSKKTARKRTSNPSTPISFVMKNTSEVQKDKLAISSPLSPYVLELSEAVEQTIFQKKTDDKVTGIESTFDGPSFDLLTPSDSGTQIRNVGAGADVLKASVDGVKGSLHDLNPEKVTEKASIQLNVPAKRISKASVYVCSPYYQREVEILDMLSSTEMKVSDRLFSLFGDANFYIFKHVDGGFVRRVVMETLIPDSYVGCEVISAWCMILNYEESLRADSSPARLYFDVKFVNQEVFHKRKDLKKLYSEFVGSVKDFMKIFKVKKDLKSFDFVFFPILADNHYYVIIFDLKDGVVHVLDNRKDHPMQYYLKVPERLTDFFGKYLVEIGCSIGHKIQKEKPNYVKMRCQTDVNDHDCGVFAMRFLESFRGGPIWKFDCGFLPEGQDQSRQISKMRKKYATKILTSDINENAQVVMEEANEFGLIPLRMRNEIKMEAYERRDVRFELI